jgi:Zn finger protein HypA/HybF involved in hydrogenase expression
MERMYRTSEGLKPESWVDEHNMFKTTMQCLACGRTIYTTVGQAMNSLPICDECESSRIKVKRGQK